MEMLARTLSALLLSLVLIATPSSAQSTKNKKDDPSQIGNRKVNNCVNLYSLEKEIALGKQLAREVQLQAKVVEDPVITEFVNRVGQNLVRNSDATVPFSFLVVEGEAPNAFALPGGFIFVYTGLIKLASEEDELAAAMAHEIAHVAARHMTCQATKSQIANIASIPLSILLPGIGGYVARQAAGVAIPTAFLHFGRRDETEADYLGTQYLYAAGYDPTGAISIFEKIESLNKKQPGRIDRIFSTHPMDADRIQKTEQEIASILPAKSEYVVNTSEYMSVRERLIQQQAKRRVDDKDANRPVLRRSTPGEKPEDPSGNEDRPTIKRRDLIE